MPPPMPHQVTIRTPGPSTEDPDTGNPVAGPGTVTDTQAWLSQKSTVDVGAQIELLATQNTVISLWTLLVPLDVDITSASTVVDSQGRKFVVVGYPADRPDPRPQWRAAALRLISDMQ